MLKMPKDPSRTATPYLVDTGSSKWCCVALWDRAVCRWASLNLLHDPDVGECTGRMMQLFTPAGCLKRFRDHPVKSLQVRPMLPIYWCFSILNGTFCSRVVIASGRQSSL